MGLLFATIVIGVLIVLYALGNLNDRLIVIGTNQILLMKEIEKIESALELIQIQNMPDDEEK